MAIEVFTVKTSIPPAAYTHLVLRHNDTPEWITEEGRNAPPRFTITVCHEVFGGVKRRPGRTEDVDCPDCLKSAHFRQARSLQEMEDELK